MSNKAGNYDAAMTGMKTATSAKADEPILWVTLGDAQLGAANKSSAALKSANKPNDDATKQLFTDAETSYKKAIDLGTAAKKPNPETIAVAPITNWDRRIRQVGRREGVFRCVRHGGEDLPASAGTYLYNEAATLLQRRHDG